jgi:hypothetical protein
MSLTLETESANGPTLRLTPPALQAPTTIKLASRSRPPAWLVFLVRPALNISLLIISDSITILFTITLGKYCEGYGLTSVQDGCDGGFYCTASSTLRTPVASLAPNGLFLAS